MPPLVRRIGRPGPPFEAQAGRCSVGIEIRRVDYQRAARHGTSERRAQGARSERLLAREDQTCSPLVFGPCITPLSGNQWVLTLVLESHRIARRA